MRGGPGAQHPGNFVASKSNPMDIPCDFPFENVYQREIYEFALREPQKIPGCCAPGPPR